MSDDIGIILDYILSLGDEGELPKMQADKGGSGDFAYEAALRLRYPSLPEDWDECVEAIMRKRNG